jgi:ribosome-associated protein
MALSFDGAGRGHKPMNAHQTDDLVITDSFVFPSAALMWRFGPSGGPGGQHANRAHTRAELGIDIVNSTAIPPELRARVIRALEPDLVDGELWVVVDETRSQWRNRQLARRQMKDKVLEAAKPPPPPRRRTTPSRAAKRRRLDEKRRRSETKRGRKRPDME